MIMGVRGGAGAARRYFGIRRRRSSGDSAEVAPPARSGALILGPACASSPSSPRPPRCSSRWASATRSPRSRTSATTRRRRSTCPRSPATSSAPASRPARSTAPCARSPSRAGRSTSSTRTALRALAPDLIVTQALCAVCAVSYDDVQALAERMDPAPEVARPRPAHARRGARGRPHARPGHGRARTPASRWWRTPRARIDRVRLAVRAAEPVRVAALEWLDPVFVAGHWTPQLIEYAGGVDVLGLPGERSEQRSWEEVAAAGRRSSSSCPAATTPSARSRRPRPTPTSSPSSAPGGSSRSTPRPTSPAPGPRLVDGLELLAHILHPDARGSGRGAEPCCGAGQSACGSSVPVHGCWSRYSIAASRRAAHEGRTQPRRADGASLTVPHHEPRHEPCGDVTGDGSRRALDERGEPAGDAGGPAGDRDGGHRGDGADGQARRDERRDAAPAPATWSMA